jgi:hypothetical protein
MVGCIQKLAVEWCVDVRTRTGTLSFIELPLPRVLTFLTEARAACNNLSPSYIFVQEPAKYKQNSQLLPAWKTEPLDVPRQDSSSRCTTCQASTNRRSDCRGASPVRSV